MLQRPQSIYLLLAGLISAGVAFFLPFFYGQEAVYLLHFPVFTAGFLLSGLISLYSIFRFRNRQQQMVAGRLNIILNFVLLGLMIYHWYVNYEGQWQAAGLGLFLPIPVVVLISLANRRIIHDEMLVRSMDRLR